MSDDKQSKITVPPPPGAADPYDVATVVGEASADILALVRAVDNLDAGTSPADRPEVETPRSAPKVEEKLEEKPEPAPAKAEGKAEPAKATVRSAPAKAALSEPPKARSAPKSAVHTPEPAGGSLSPAISIPLFFVLVAAVLALLVR